jgi:hypothetical protein
MEEYSGLKRKKGILLSNPFLKRKINTDTIDTTYILSKKGTAGHRSLS